MDISLVGLATGFAAIGRNPDDDKISCAAGLVITSIVARNVFYSVGLSSITLVYTSKIFPLWARALGCTLGVAFNCTVSTVVTMMMFLSMSNAIINHHR
ncbi:unnamed protein product [Urochloa humidicola]